MQLPSLSLRSFALGLKSCGEILGERGIGQVSLIDFSHCPLRPECRGTAGKLRKPANRRLRPQAETPADICRMTPLTRTGSRVT
jgi:hypothetical protein